MNGAIWARFTSALKGKHLPMTATTPDSRSPTPSARLPPLRTCLRRAPLGEFKTKSGRLSPYFFNSGLFNTGESLHRFAVTTTPMPRWRWRGLRHAFGPAYRGFRAGVALASDLPKRSQFAVFRSTARGQGPRRRRPDRRRAAQGRVLIVDDVITAGTSVRRVGRHHSGTGAEARRR